VGAFSNKFSIAPSGETTDRIKKVGGCKNGTELLYHRAKYGWDRGSHAGCREKKVWLFCLSVCLSRFGITKFVITETLFSKQLWYYSTFCGPQNFSLGANITIFRHCDGCKPHIFKATSPQRWNLGRGCGRGSPSTCQILQKPLKGVYPFWQIYTKNTNFGDFGAVWSTLFKQQWWNFI